MTERGEQIVQVVSRPFAGLSKDRMSAWDAGIARLYGEIMTNPVAHALKHLAEQVFREYDAEITQLKANQALADAVFRLNEVRDWAERNVVPLAPDDSHAQALETGFLRAVSDVLAILDKP